VTRKAHSQTLSDAAAAVVCWEVYGTRNCRQHTACKWSRSLCGLMVTSPECFSCELLHATHLRKGVNRVSSPPCPALAYKGTGRGHVQQKRRVCSSPHEAPLSLSPWIRGLGPRLKADSLSFAVAPWRYLDGSTTSYRVMHAADHGLLLAGGGPADGLPALRGDPEHQGHQGEGR
jgi:hypothetical protein